MKGSIMATTIRDEKPHAGCSQLSVAFTVNRQTNLQKRVATLRQLIFPLTKAHIDSHGNIIQLWSVPEARVVGTVHASDGSIRHITSNKIRNPLNPAENTTSLHQRLLIASDCEWEYALTDSGTLTIWPHLIASGWRDALPKSSEDFRGLTKLSRERTREQMCAWFYSNGYKVVPPGKSRPLPEIEIHKEGALVGKLNAENHEGIRNLLQQGGIIKAIHFSPPPAAQQKDPFQGGGLTFTHPKDQSQTTFNVDFTRVGFDEIPGGRPEEKGGYHIDVRGPNLKGKIQVSTKETYQANYFERKEGKKPYFKLQASSFAAQKAHQPRRAFSPAMQAFQRKLQQTRLTDSYNATHPKNPVPPKGAKGGSIGGVACGMVCIEGLFEDPEVLFEREHFFCVPGLSDGNLPFSDRQLRQILRELAIGIYNHSAIPFFSLHFNDQADQYPVIHPAYERTLVGRVISMLDYIMKGYLNGGVFIQDFIDDWHTDPDWEKKEKDASEALIDFQKYCEEHQLEDYVSLRDFQKILAMSSRNILDQLDVKLEEAIGQRERESNTLKDLKGFRNSFRIIAKQNSIRKEGNLFLIDADFDVLYTIEPSLEYKSALDAHMREYGSQPPSYRDLERAYKFFCERIHDHMVKLPICRDYFAMLGVINFFSSYFATLKSHQKIPVLPPMLIFVEKGSPPLFPYLPIREIKSVELKMNPSQLMTSVFEKHKAVMDAYFWQMNPGLFTSAGSRISKERDAFYGAIRSELEDQLIQSDPYARAIAPTVKNTQEIQEVLDSNAKRITDKLEKMELTHIQWANETIQAGSSYRIINRTMYETFCKTANESFPNKWSNVVDIRLPDLRMLPDLQTIDVETGTKIVGGCSMSLKRQAIRVCQVAHQILLDYEGQLKQINQEEWLEIFYGPERKQGFAFRLPYEDAHYDSYEWMESLLAPSGTDNVAMQERFGIEKAMRENDKKEFLALLDSSTRLRRDVYFSHPSGIDIDYNQRPLNTLFYDKRAGLYNVRRMIIETSKPMRDRFQRTLMHSAASMQDPFYLETLVAKELDMFAEDVHGYQPSHYAAMHGFISGLEFLIKKGGSEALNARSRDGSTPLITAIQHERLEAMKYLLSHKASFSALADGYTPLHCALHSGNLPIIQEVLNSGQAPQWINHISKEGGTALMLACELDSAELVEKLLSKGALPELKRGDGVTAVEIAITRNFAPVVAVLLTAFSKKAASLPPQALETAAELGSPQVLELLMAKPLFYRYRNFYGDTTLIIALRHGNIRGADLIIQNCSDKEYLMAKNHGGESALSLAAMLYQWDIITKLDKKGAIDKALIRSSLDTLLRADFHPQLGSLLERCELTEQELKKFAIHTAQVGNHITLWTEFFTRGVKHEDIRGPKGWTLIHYMTKADDVSLFLQVTEGRGDILCRLPQDGGKTLPYIAYESKSRRILRHSLRQLKEARVPLERHFYDKHLFYPVIETRDLAYIQLFLNTFSERKSELLCTALDDMGTTAVLLAAKFGSLKLLRFFVNEGVDVEAKDRKGNNALCHALRAGASKVVSYLLEKHLDATLTSQALFVAASEEDETFFTKMIALNKSQKNLDHALLLALQADNTRAYLRLHQHGASSENLPLDGSAIGQRTILKAMQSKGSPKAASMAELISQIRRKEGAMQALEMIQSWPLNETIEIERQGEIIWGTALQLLLRILGNQISQDGVEWFLKHPELDPHVRDSNGNTLMHLLLGADIFPFEFKIIDWQSVNHLGESPLHIAAKSKKPQLLNEVLKKTVVVDAKDGKERTPLMYAILAGKLKNVKLLLASGADVNLCDIHLNTPLVLSYLGPNPSLSILHSLLKAGANPNQIATIEQMSPLALAIQSSSEEFSKCLIFNGADCLSDKTEDQSLLHFAVGKGKVSLMNLLRAKGLSLEGKNEQGFFPVHMAAYTGNIEVMKAIQAVHPNAINWKVKNLENPSIDGATPLHMAAKGNQLMMTQFLLEKPVEVKAETTRGESAFSFAAGSATKPVMDLFSPYELTTEALRSAITEAIIYDNIDLVIDLHLQGMPIDFDLDCRRGFTALHLASLHGSVQATHWLLRNGADAFYPCSSGEDSLRLAAGNSSPAQFSLLLDYVEPDLDEWRNDKEMLLHTAARNGNIHHMAYLIQHFATINVRDVMGLLPIHRAIQEGHHSVVSLLLACGSIHDESLARFVDKDDDIMRKILKDSAVWLESGCKGDTPLHTAIRSGNPLALRLMISTEDINQKNSNGEMPLDLARSLGNQEACRHLINAGADSKPIWDLD